MASLVLEDVLKQFTYDRLSRIRGEAHDAIVGEWIRWWLEVDPQNHLAINPAKYVDAEDGKSYSADILFCRKDAEELELQEIVGVGEIENKRKKWFEKLESLKAYALSMKYPSLRFTLLCVRIYSRKDEELFTQLLERMKKLSMLIPKTDWILCSLREASGKEDIDLVAVGDDVYWHRFISGRSWIIIKNGKARAVS